MKTINLKSILFYSVAMIIFIIQSCKTEETVLLASINTNSEVTGITAISATSGGEIISDNGFTVTQRGVCWSNKIDPTINDSLSKDGSGAGKFTSNLKNLTPNSSYYVRAYAINKNGVSYGNTLNFTTDNGIVLVEAKSLTDTTATSIVCKTDFKSSGGLTVISKGICWSKNTTPTIQDNVLTNNLALGLYSDTIKNLTSNTKYYVRAFVSTALGTTYSNELSFVTRDQIPLNGLIAWYPFNGNANDESGNGNNGINYGATLTSDRFGNSNSAYSFKNSYIKCTNSNIPNNSFTLSVWIYENTSFADNEFVCLGSAASTKWGAICSPLHTTMNYGRGCGAFGGNTITPTIPIKSWQHIVFVSQGKSLNCDVYVNGVKVGTTKNNDEGGCNTDNLYFGVDIFSAPEYIDGALDDIGIWNRALTQEEITKIYNLKN